MTSEKDVCILGKANMVQYENTQLQQNTSEVQNTHMEYLTSIVSTILTKNIFKLYSNLLFDTKKMKKCICFVLKLRKKLRSRVA